MGESCPSLLVHFNIDCEKRYMGWGNLVSSEGTPALVNMHAGMWAVVSLGGGCRDVTGVMDD